MLVSVPEYPGLTHLPGEHCHAIWHHASPLATGEPVGIYNYAFPFDQLGEGNGWKVA